MSREILHQITETILFSRHPGELRTACHELYEYFSAITGLNDATENESDLTDTFFDSGKALSPRGAARCIWDFARTSTFMRGVNAAICELQKQFPGERLEILYAGTGPFAPLLIPLLSRFSPEDLEVTFLDIHQNSLNHVEHIIDELKLKAFVAGMVQADAVKYRHGRSLHLVICEVLQKVLRKEPQVVAERNLAPQLVEQGVFIPQQITIDACMGDLTSEIIGDSRPRIELGTLLKLDADMLRKNPEMELPAVTVDIPDIDLTRLGLILLTRLQVFNSFVLKDYDSSLTYPTMIDLPETAANDRIEFTYIEGSFPHRDHRIISK